MKLMTKLVGKLKFPKDQDDFIKSDLMPDFLVGQGKKQVTRTVMKCVDKFNDRYPPTCPPEEKAKVLADRAAVSLLCLYHRHVVINATLVCQDAYV